MVMNKTLLIGVVVLVAVFTAWKIAPQEKVVYRDKPQPSPTDCNLTIPKGHDAFVRKGDYGGERVTVVGYVKNEMDCAYYVHIKAHGKWFDRYFPVNENNLVGL
jgi:hypothetical protein